MTGDTTLALGGELTIYRAQEIRQQLFDALRPGATLDCDLSAVEEIDSVGVQLLLLAHRTAVETGGRVRPHNLSAAAAELFELLALAGHFDAAPALAAG